MEKFFIELLLLMHKMSSVIIPTPTSSVIFEMESVGTEMIVR